ncbi:hypothetical protein [Pseudomonas cremoricolorata]|uniref:hypothetical protein n=1 Tax=Pseudomonas cremoricolorata TaxID=157783 RepID=UPI000676700A|nr:hypothetical protein [Pseudomonas cremoricolorata]
MTDYQHKLGHLSAGQIETLYQEYLAGARIAPLLERYAVELRPNSLVKAFPPKACSDLQCPWCLQSLYIRRRGKTEPEHSVNEAFCLSCPHRHYFPAYNRLQRYCICAPCAASRAQAKQNHDDELRGEIDAYWGLQGQPLIPYERLSLAQKVALMAIVEARGSARSDRIEAVQANGTGLRLSPSQGMDARLFDELRQQHLLLLDPDSDLEAFSLNPAMPRLERVRWVCNVTLDDQRRARLTEVYQRLHQEFARGPQPQWQRELGALVRQLAVEEVLGHLEQRCSEHGLALRGVEHTREIAAQLLQRLPVCSVWYLANSALRSAVQFAERCNVNALHAAQTLPGKLGALGQRAIDEQWPLEASRHSANAARSAYSRVLHGLLLGQHDGGVERPLSDYLKALPEPLDSAPRAGDTWHCSRCGSSAVKTRVEAQQVSIRCRCCDARSVLLVERTTAQ